MHVEGDFDETCMVTWESVSERARATWHDLPEAVEHGTYGVAALLVEELMQLTVVERSAKGTGFDYWLGADCSACFFQRRFRLEVSGILKRKEQVSSRTENKLRQVQRGVESLPAVVVVVEYGTPTARIVTR